MSSSSSSSSSTPQLWATASKEWVILPKSKPGRKPKKDVAPVQTDELDSKGRRVQNRAAQRAFRERKQSQLADLQARVQSYEQGEMERNVALQNIAKRLKEENEMLRRENALLKDKLAKAEDRDIPRDNDRKRWRDDSPASSIASTQRKKYKVDHEQVSRFAASYISSPQSMVSSPESSSDSRFSSVPFDAQVDVFTAFSTFKSESSSFTTFDCGFCSDGAPCVCRDVFQQASAVAEHKINVTPVRSIVLGSPPPEETSILDNLPPYQPPVPLRLRPRNGTQINTIFQVSPPSQSTPANCSGDPSNCPACADDSFGKAFCEKISEISTAQCDDCPCPSEVMPEVGLSLQHPVAIQLPSQPASFTETIPTNDAWQRLKSHPNVAFADLTMLADVVVRRARCTGSHTASPSPQPECIQTPPVVTTVSESEQPVLLTDPHAHFHEKERARASRSPPRQEQRRIREVPAEGVRDALRLLDAKFQ
ncbi:hypothetical protein FB45DRAFT_1152993 [Roridomyces roridus]|uniref:BZIP domain-containing protein n=1 Tax=Roridomyces roridus TaxID=1738132 RepID=A0AAD7BV18_9AGAR|nr:hypothetical protein FB45DRAFT_1152993 [Roridomyces roridus]